METIFHCRVNKNSFSQERLCTWPLFESEGFWNSEVAMTGNAVSNSFAHPVIEGNAEAECTQLPSRWVSCAVFVECVCQTVLS